jgi:ERCC4-type nuclease
MILVDERVGSRELLSQLRGYGVDADLAKLDADFQWSGSGEEKAVLCGVERKTLQDLLNSMRDRRLAGHQVGTMLRTYDVCYLVVEGVWRRGRNTGLIETRNGVGWHVVRGNFKYAEAVRFLASLRELGGIRVWRTADEEETAAWIAEEFHWWQKDWEEHRTAKTLYTSELGKVPRQGTRATFRTEATVLEKWISALPGIDERALELARYFSCPKDLANADTDRWMTLKGCGLKIGRKTAERIVAAIEG